MNARRIVNQAAALGLLAAAGCQGEPEHASPSQAAQEALNLKGGQGNQRTVETRRAVDVIDERKVVDRQTGEVLSDKKEVTPVTVEKTREIETHVQEGKTSRTPQ